MAAGPPGFAVRSTDFSTGAGAGENLGDFVEPFSGVNWGGVVRCEHGLLLELAPTTR